MTEPPYYPPPPPYGAPPPYGGPYGPGLYPYPTPQPTNGMAIASLVCAFLFAPLGIVFGHISLSQIKRTGEEGRGLAVAGLVISYLVTAPAKPPRPGKVPTAPATVNATMVTNDGTIGLLLDNAKAPCTVNSFVSLAQQGYFDNTPCHRLTASAALAVLQCGDPTGTGRGGPGYRFANEYPTNQYRPFDPALQQSVRYPRGTLAMANAGPDSNGSQFFIIYRDSLLPPTYTVFGRVDETGLRTVDAIAGAGITGDAEDGKPKNKAIVTSVRLD